MSDLTVTVAGMTGELKVVAEALAEDKVWRRRFVAALGVMALMFVLLVVVAVQNNQNGRVVRDTIDPGGERYQRGQKAQAAVIDRLVTDEELDRTAQTITDCLLGRGPCPGDS